MTATTAMRGSTRETILDLAEAGFRKGGYAGISFRDIAQATGMKSASVHYHFPTKADLVVATIGRYADRFFDVIGRPDDPADAPMVRIERLAAAYCAALHDGKASCLCAVLGTAVDPLPPRARAAVSDFYERLLAWSAAALGDKHGVVSPSLVIAALQGAMALSIATDDPRQLEIVAQALPRLLVPSGR